MLKMLKKLFFANTKEKWLFGKEKIKKPKLRASKTL
jgi:hypothetical protein